MIVLTISTLANSGGNNSNEYDCSTGKKLEKQGFLIDSLKKKAEGNKELQLWSVLFHFWNNICEQTTSWPHKGKFQIPSLCTGTPEFAKKAFSVATDWTSKHNFARTCDCLPGSELTSTVTCLATWLITRLGLAPSQVTRNHMCRVDCWSWSKCNFKPCAVLHVLTTLLQPTTKKALSCQY